MRLLTILTPQLAERAVGDGDDRDVSSAVARRRRVGPVIERDALAVGRPLEVTNREGAARQRAGRPRLHVADEQMRHAMILIDDLEFAVLLLAILQRRR